MTTTFDATITLTPSSLAGTALLDRPQEAVHAEHRAVEAMSGAAWIDGECKTSAASGRWSIAWSFVLMMVKATRKP